MTAAKHGSNVKVHYRGTFSDGTLFDSSKGCDPLTFTIGQGQVIVGFENAVIGMNPGETKTVVIAADQAYGPHLSEMVADVDLSQFPGNITPEIGQVLQLRRPDGEPIRVTITAISGSTVTLDANHPMAGKDLTFEIQLMEIA
jgi:FKBP-type peptidyl-prolyl cis-trans isomerase 2